MPLMFGLDGVLKKLSKKKPPEFIGSNGDLQEGQFDMLASNVMAVGPQRSSDGFTRLWINTHQPWEGPVSWYEAHLVSEEGWDFYGALFPGSPVPLIGHNNYLGWSHTVNEPDLIDVYKLNYEQNNLSNSYFEINTVFDNSKNKIYEDVPNQNIVLGFLTSSTLTNTDTRLKDEELDLYYVKNILTQLLSTYNLEPISKPGFHQNYSFSIIKNGQIIGHFGQLATETQMTLEFNNEIYLGEIYINKLNLNNLKEINYEPLSQYPFVKFDLSFSVPIDLSAHLLVDEINDLLKENENSIEIFDDFQQENSRNLGIRIITRSYDKTYDDNETREILMNISQTLESKFNITLNSSKND